VQALLAELKNQIGLRRLRLWRLSNSDVVTVYSGRAGRMVAISFLRSLDAIRCLWMTGECLVHRLRQPTPFS